MSNVKALADSVLSEDPLPGLKKGAFSLWAHMASPGSFIFLRGEVVSFFLQDIGSQQVDFLL